MLVKRLRRYGDGDTYRLVNTISKERYEGEYTHTGGWTWEVIDDDGRSTGYRTDKDGCGLWRGYDNKQLLGTCQYRAAQTYSGQRRKILRDMDE